MATNIKRIEEIKENNKHWEEHDGKGYSYDRELLTNELLLIIAEELCKMNTRTDYLFDNTYAEQNRLNNENK